MDEKDDKVAEEEEKKRMRWVRRRKQGVKMLMRMM